MRKVWPRRLLKILIFGAVALLASPLVARFLIVSHPIAKPEAVVVLSGAATFIERTRYASQIFENGRTERILLTNDNLQSGWSEAQKRNPYYYERAVDELERLGVPRTNIEVIRHRVADTHDEAVRLREYCTEKQIKSLLIITSAYHTRRAFAVFKDVFNGSGIVIGVEPVPTGMKTPSPMFWWLYPSGWLMVPTEYVKMIYYKLAY